VELPPCRSTCCARSRNAPRGPTEVTGVLCTTCSSTSSPAMSAARQRAYVLDRYRPLYTGVGGGRLLDLENGPAGRVRSMLQRAARPFGADVITRIFGHNARSGGARHCCRPARTRRSPRSPRRCARRPASIPPSSTRCVLAGNVTMVFARAPHRPGAAVDGRRSPSSPAPAPRRPPPTSAFRVPRHPHPPCCSLRSAPTWGPTSSPACSRPG